MTENPGTSFSKKPLLYAMAGVLMLAALLAGAIRMSAADLKVLWPQYRFNVMLDQSLLLALEDELRWAIRNTLVDGVDMPNYLNHVSLDALKAVSPAAVTVIH